MKRTLFLSLLLTIAVVAISCVNHRALAHAGRLGLNNGLARTPQMGWNSWNKYNCFINETLIRATADGLIKHGFLDAGYKYLNLDDCWQSSRSELGVIQADPQTFPSGIPDLAKYVHSKGLKFGLYSSAGTKTCQGRPGGLYFEEIDAQTYASWEVDYLKYDNCYDASLDVHVRYPIMRDALNATGRPMLYSLCEWGVEDPATWAPQVGNSWRTTGDIGDNWPSMTSNIDKNDLVAKYAGPGGWNDPDMLEVGNGGMTWDEYRVHFSLWALAKAPLLTGTDVVNPNPKTLEILLNKEVIAVNQDPLGVQGKKVSVAGQQEVWAGPLANGDVAVVLLNRATANATVTANWSTLGLSSSTRASVRDLWSHSVVGTYTGSFSSNLATHSCRMLRITPQK